MAKKTNKTNHVLNLLSGADEQDAEVKKATEETEPKIQIVNQNQEDSIAADVQQMLEEELLQEEQALQAQREKETEWQTEAAAADAAAAVPAAEPVSEPVSDAEPIAVPAASAADHAETAAPADTSAAEAEPDSAETAAQTAEPESAADEAGVSAEAAAAETAASETDMNTEEAAASETDTNTAETAASETDMNTEEAAASGTDANTAADAASEVDRNTAEAVSASAASAAETAHETPVSDAGQPQAAPAATSPEPAAAEPEVPSYALLNVMERLVDDKLDYYMKKFDVCTCPRCRVDVKALALSHMEAKYVVLDKSGISAFLSLYTNKYASEVMFHLGKACMQVLESPRH